MAMTAKKALKLITFHTTMQRNKRKEKERESRAEKMRNKDDGCAVQLANAKVKICVVVN